MKWRAYMLCMLICLGAAASAADLSDEMMVDPAVSMEQADSYYITKGKKYDSITALFSQIPSESTGLTGAYYFRIEKNLTSDYFYHVKAYDSLQHLLQGNYFVAKDNSCVWKLEKDGSAALIYGTAENLIKKVKVVVYPKKLAVGSYGIVRIHVPGMLPYDVKITSLNGEIAGISDKLNIVPMSPGKTDIVVDIKIGQSERTFTESISVFDTADKESKRRGTSVGVGFGVGWGSGGHHGGGIGIGVGPWW